MSEPTTIQAGDSISWSRSLPDYPPSAGWALHYRFLAAVPPAQPFDATPSADGTEHQVTLAASATAAFPPGLGTLISWVQKGTERITVGQQPLTVLADLTAATSLDTRTANQKALADAKAALSAYLAGGNGHVEEYEIAGRRMRYRSAKDLQDLVAFYERLVARDTANAAAAQGFAPGRVITRM